MSHLMLKRYPNGILGGRVLYRNEDILSPENVFSSCICKQTQTFECINETSLV